MRNRTFEERYQENDIPWDRDAADENLIRAVEKFNIQPCRVLDLGCGTGINAVWLAQQGFEVSGLDLSPSAIKKAEERARSQNISMHLFSCDFLDRSVVRAPFDFIFDRGCFHSFDCFEDRSSCANRIADLLTPGGRWLSLTGNADDVPREVGPPTMSATELAQIVEPRFELLSLTAGWFGGDQNDPPKAWIGLMKKRA
ncbi:methyltransferase domain-containing protein [Pontiellaceae bacterium B12227]|nr:methyltransferase domain-containing protein [Pontiellaceae bacterium B12227]